MTAPRAWVVQVSRLGRPKIVTRYRTAAEARAAVRAAFERWPDAVVGEWRD